MKLVVIYVNSTDIPTNADEIIEHLRTEVRDKVSLETFLVEDWNSDLTPWPAPPIYKDQRFGGDGSNTLLHLRDYVSKMRNKYPDAKIIIMGYSLAGLFSLWCAYETELFDGVISCSGSLWYPGWYEYVKAATFNRDVHVYLSLGVKEEETKNAVMAAVGDNTRAQHEILKKDEHVLSSVLEWNEGGHFNNPDERLARGIEWIFTDGNIC